MTDETLEQSETSIMTAAYASFSMDVPDWTSMPISALFIYLEDRIYEARDWAFKCQSPKHTQEWAERIQRYAEIPQMREKMDIQEEPEIADELGKVMLNLLGAAAVVVAVALRKVSEDGEIDFDAVWTDEFIQSDEYKAMEGWGDQSLTWMLLMMEQYTGPARAAALACEVHEDTGVELSNAVMPILVLASSIMYILMMDKMDDETKELVRAQLEELMLDGEIPPPEEQN
jgi:hypothetical protein